MIASSLAVVLSVALAFAPATTYTQDPVGNRTQVVSGPTTTPYAHNTLNQYTTVAGVALTYDANGNLTSDGIRTYAYDAENRLTTAIGPGLSASYAYDAFGRRIAKTVNGTTTRFLYDGDQLLEDRSATGAFLAAYGDGSGIDEVLFRYTNTGQLLVYHADPLGSPQFLLDWSGTPLEGTAYDAYGTPSSPFALGNRFGFTGREYDSETGLYYYRARYYSPTLGRFLSRDPLTWAPNDPRIFDANNLRNRFLWSLGLSQANISPAVFLYLAEGISQRLLSRGGAQPLLQNLYPYVQNNPINFRDPSGKISGALVGYLVAGTIFAVYLYLLGLGLNPTLGKVSAIQQKQSQCDLETYVDTLGEMNEITENETLPKLKIAIGAGQVAQAATPEDQLLFLIQEIGKFVGELLNGN